MDFTKFQENIGPASRYNAGQQGVFGLHPAMTPKYAVNKGNRDNEFRDSMARMFLSLSGASTSVKRAYLRSLQGLGADVVALAKVLIGAQTGPNGGTGFIDFFLAQVQEQYNEKMQVSEVLSDNYVAYFFGQQPPVFTFSGTLLNSFQDDQRIGMGIAYQQLLRGTQCARRGSLLRIRYDAVIVSGTVINMSQVLNADNEVAVPFNFQMLVKQYLIALNPALATTKVETRFDAGTQLDNVGSIQDVRVRTSLFVPDRLAANSVLGADQTQIPTNKSVEDQAAQSNAPTPTADILGTLQSTPDQQLTPNVPNFPAAV